MKCVLVILLALCFSACDGERVTRLESKVLSLEAHLEADPKEREELKASGQIKSPKDIVIIGPSYKTDLDRQLGQVYEAGIRYVSLVRSDNNPSYIKVDLSWVGKKSIKQYHIGSEHIGNRLSEMKKDRLDLDLKYLINQDNSKRIKKMVLIALDKESSNKVSLVDLSSPSTKR